MEKISDYYKENGLTELAEQDRQRQFNKKNDSLQSMIRKDFDKEKDSLRKNVLNELLKLNCYNEERYEVKEFLYNYGHFRTESEINEYNRRIKAEEQRQLDAWHRECDKNYFSSGQYEEDCGGSFHCWIPFIANCGFLLIALIAQSTDMFWVNLFATPITLSISMVLRAKHSDNCIKIANEHKYYAKTSPKYNYEVTTLHGMYIGGVVAATKSFHSISANLKEVCNPDSWNVLK